MTLQQWLDNGWVISAVPSRLELANLLSIAEREIADASLQGMSADGAFDHAYSAVRTLCQAALHATGYSIQRGVREHERVIESLKFTLDDEWTQEADYYDHCRRKRHQTMYERSGVTQAKDAAELVASAKRLLGAVRQWLSDKHPEML